MKRLILVLYGVTAYVLFNLSFVYLLGFLQEMGVPKAINDGEASLAARALAINVFLVFLFGFFHSLMARESFKRWWTKYVPESAERPTYVLQSAIFLMVAMFHWQPMTQVIWQLEGIAAVLVQVLFVAGVLTLLTSTFLIDHFELFGLKQVWSVATTRDLPEPEFVQPLLYRVVRHPMQLGMVTLLFATPLMTTGHLVFATAMTVYILIGLYFEERSLLRQFGARYESYQEQVPMLIPRLLPRSGTVRAKASEEGGVQ